MALIPKQKKMADAAANVAQAVAAAATPGFWESYKFLILAAGAALAIVGVYLYFRWSYSQKEKKLKKDRIKNRVQAEQFAHHRAQQLAEEYARTGQQPQASAVAAQQAQQGSAPVVSIPQMSYTPVGTGYQPEDLGSDQGEYDDDDEGEEYDEEV